MFLKEISDDLLVCLCRNKNQDAIDLLYDRYNKFLYGIINDMFKRENLYIDYEDMFQESMVVFINCIDRYDEDSGCFYFFVRKSVERKLVDRIRKLKRNNKIISLDESFYSEGKESNVDYVAEESYEAATNSLMYSFLIDKLDEDSRKIVDLKIEGYTYEEISYKLGISRQAVYRRINKIKNILKDIIKN